jgi:hypothetical protein
VAAVVEDVEVHRGTIPGAPFGNRVTDRQTLMEWVTPMQHVLQGYTRISDSPTQHPELGK